MRVRGFVGAIAVAALGLSACGGSSDDSEPAAQSEVTASEESSGSEESSASSEESESTPEPAPEDATQEAEAQIPYFYAFGCEGAAETLLDMSAFFAEFDPADASSDDAATFRAMGEAMIATANLPEEGAMGEGVTAADQAIYATGVAAVDLADVIDNAGFTREIEEATDILGFDATNAVTECELE